VYRFSHDLSQSDVCIHWSSLPSSGSSKTASSNQHQQRAWKMSSQGDPSGDVHSIIIFKVVLQRSRMLQWHVGPTCIWLFIYGRFLINMLLYKEAVHILNLKEKSNLSIIYLKLISVTLPL